MSFAGTDMLDGEVVATRLRMAPESLLVAEAGSVAATLLADGVFSEPYCEWLPLWYELALVLPVRYGAWRLRRIARDVAATAGITVTTPRFSRPRDVTMAGRSPLAYVDGFRDRFVLAAALLHLEWFVHVAAADGITVPSALVTQTRRESLAYYTGRTDELSPDVRRFQRLLFTDDTWVRDVDTAYGLDSTLFGLWNRLLSDERRRLTAD